MFDIHVFAEIGNLCVILVCVYEIIGERGGGGGVIHLNSWKGRQVMSLRVKK